MKIREIYIWGKKNCIIDNGVIAKMNEPDIVVQPTIVQQNCTAIATNDMAILQQNIETSKTFSKLYDKWKGHDNLCFDILVSSDFIVIFIYNKKRFGSVYEFSENDIFVRLLLFQGVTVLLKSTVKWSVGQSEF